MTSRNALMAVLMAAAVTTVVVAQGRSEERGGANNDDRQSGSYAIGLWGDLPYSDLQATVGVPNLIADMNRQDLAFTVHNGDLKAGSSTPNSMTPTHLLRCAVRAGARLLQCAQRASHVHTRRQRLDRLRSEDPHGDGPGTAWGRLCGLPEGAARRSGGLPQTGRVCSRRLALLPHRQTFVRA